MRVTIFDYGAGNLHSLTSGRTVGVQFHPEKSSRAGVAVIHAFLEEARR